jgi:cytidylate kinase
MPGIGISKLNLPHVMGAVRSQVKSTGLHPAGVVAGLKPFITISREAGAGGLTLGHLLVDRLNRMEEGRYGTAGGAEGPAYAEQHVWRCYDRELIEKVAADAHLSTDIIESLEKTSHTWVEEFFDGLKHSDRGSPSELGVFKRVVSTVRGLAQAGRVVLVGLGGVFITRTMPGGIHIRLAAPVEFRIHNMARQYHLSEAAARDRVQTLDANRIAFLHRYWPHLDLAPEIFHMALNSGAVTDEQMVDCILPLLRPRMGS